MRTDTETPPLPRFPAPLHRRNRRAGKRFVAVLTMLAALGVPAVSRTWTAALDRTTGREVVSILQRLAREQGASILMVTHDNRVLDIADRVIHMEDGRLADGTAS